MLHEVLNSPTPTPLLREWANATLTGCSWEDALVAASNVRISFYPDIPPGPDALALEFITPRFTVYRAVCECLETIDRIMDASKCFRHLADELGEQTDAHVEQVGWVLGEWSRILCWCRHLCHHCVLDFKCRCSGKLEGLGDTAMGAGQHDDAISWYSAALSVDPTAPQGLFIKRSKAYIARGLWDAALSDASKVCPFVSRRLVLVDRSSPGDRARSIVSMGLRGEACSVTQRRRLWKCDKCIRDDAVEHVTVI